MGRLTGANNVAQLFPSAAPSVSPEDVRIAEALVFAAAEPLEESAIAQRLSKGADVASGHGGIANGSMTDAASIWCRLRSDGCSAPPMI